MQQQQQQGHQPVVQQVPTMYSPNQPITILPQHQVVEDKFKPSALKQMKVLSSIQIAMGLLCIIFGIVLSAIKAGPIYGLGNVGYGIWNGIFFSLVGASGIAAAKFNRSGWIIGNMVLNIFCSASWCVTLASLSSVGMILTSNSDCRFDLYSFYNYTDIDDDYIDDCEDNKNVYYALDSLMVVMSLIQFIITIWCAALCCEAVCRCCKSPSTMANGTHMVQYSAGVGQQVVYPSMPMNTYSAFPVAQAGFNIQQGYTVGGPQPAMGGFIVQQQGAPGYTVQHQANPGCTTGPQNPPAYAEQNVATTYEEVQKM